MSTICSKPKLILSPENYSRLEVLAQKGQLGELKSFVKGVFAGRHKKPFERRLVEEEQHTSGGQGIIRSHPVIEAAHNGHHQIVEYFITNFSDIICIDSSLHSHQQTRNSTALHLAAESGHVQILKFLVESGAEVNCRDTSTGRTPLHSAVRLAGHEDAVEYLISCQADVNAVDTIGRTPLHTVILHHTQSRLRKDIVWLCRVVQMFLKSGASLCQAAHNGCTVFHGIAMFNNDTGQQILKALMNSNPRVAWKVLQMPSKGQRYTELPAILYAAEWRNRTFVDFIISQPECSPTTAADALLALSTSQDVHEFSIQNKTIIELWEKAFKRYGQSLSSLPSNYGNRVEIRSLDEAYELISVAIDSCDFTDLHYQFLIMRERIFGTGSRATIQYLWKFGHELCEKNHFAEAEQLYTKALKMMVLNITGEYSQPGCYTDSSHLYSTLKTEFNYYVYKSVGGNDYKPNFYLILGYGLVLAKHPTAEHDPSIRDFLPLLFSLFGIWAYDEWKTRGCLTNEIEEIGHEIVVTFTLLNVLIFSFGCTSLPPNISKEEHEKYISFMVSNVFCWEACLSAINAMDCFGTRPLHVVATEILTGYWSPWTITGGKEMEFASMLVDNGAHQDAVDSEGRTAYELCTIPEIKAVVAPPKPLPLTCLASRAVVAGGISYNDLKCIPWHIKRFIALHDCHAKRCKFRHRMN